MYYFVGLYSWKYEEKKASICLKFTSLNYANNPININIQNKEPITINTHCLFVIYL